LTKDLPKKDNKKRCFGIAFVLAAQKSRFIGVIFLFASKCGNKRGKQFFCTTSESTRARDFLRYNAYIT
jgi:hypothetical protein